jgi:hypothetical protein
VRRQEDDARRRDAPMSTHDSVECGERTLDRRKDRRAHERAGEEEPRFGATDLAAYLWARQRFVEKHGGSTKVIIAFGYAQLHVN